MRIVTDLAFASPVCSQIARGIVRQKIVSAESLLNKVPGGIQVLGIAIRPGTPSILMSVPGEGKSKDGKDEGN